MKAEVAKYDIGVRTCILTEEFSKLANEDRASFLFTGRWMIETQEGCTLMTVVQCQSAEF